MTRSLLQEARDLPEGARVVVILPDSVRNYMTKYLSDDWMIEKGFLNPSEADDLSQQWCVLVEFEAGLYVDTK